MILDVRIGPYKIEKRTEYSKIKVYDTKTAKDLTVTNEWLAEKILSDYYKQKENPKKYFDMYDDELLNATDDLTGEKITFVFIPDCIKFITENAFEYESAISHISIPNSVVEIADYAFFECDSLKEIYIPDSVMSIGECAFSGCSALEEARLPKYLKVIEEESFYECSNLKNVILQNNLNEIKQFAFFGTEKLQTINLPENLKIIGNGVFTLSGISKLILPKSLETIGAKIFSECSELEEITIPGNIKEIPHSAFSKCDKLKTVNLEDNIKIIKSQSFINCKALKNINFPDTIKYIDNCIFEGADKIKNINIPKNFVGIEGNPFLNSNIESLTFNYDVEHFSNYGGWDIIDGTKIHKLIISNNVKWIAPDMFRISGKQINEIDYIGTEEEFNKFKKYASGLFESLPNLEKVNFISDKEKEQSKSITPER